MKAFVIALSLLSFAIPVAAQEATELLTGVQDNSFLLEEAYNQEPGVVQHINMLLYDGDADAFGYSFAQEWPIRSLKHQFSYTIPLGYADGGDFELGDISLDYRYQWIGDAQSRLAVSPRVSLIVPTGEGSDDAGVQVGLPISRIFSPRIIGHTNVGATWFSGDTDAEFFVGQSFVYAINPRFNALIEALWTGNGDDGQLLISPGLRVAHNLRGGGQLVPGLAYVRATEGGDAVLLYLSYEK